MATRRMLSSQIVNSDAFLDMPISSQLLYFHLVMQADDDGFVGNPKRIMKMLGTNEDDLKIIIAKRFVLIFQSGVVVIKHWLIHNTIRLDRYHSTQYRDEKNILTIKENKSYTERQPVGNQLATESNIIESNLNKSKVVAKSDTLFSLQEEIKKLEDSPRRDLNIIALYFEYRKPDFENRQQYEIALKRHLKPAQDLKEFSDTQILYAIGCAEKEYKKIYTLETLIKILTK